MQESEEFCRKIDIKLKKTVTATLIAVFAAVLAAGLSVYFFAPKDDYLISKFSGQSSKQGNSGVFLLSSVSSYENVSLETVSSEFSEDSFNIVILAENRSGSDIIFNPSDLRVYTSDISDISKPCLCRTDMTESVVIPTGSSVHFSVSGSIPEGHNTCSSKITLIFTDSESGRLFCVMPD